jgi:hypothetical protein
MMAELLFPPYGVMDQAEQAAVRLTAPADWIGDASAPTHLEQWLAWRDGVLKDINQVLWPQWDPTNVAWQEAESLYTMERLTRADLHVLEAMGRKLPGRGLDSLPDSPNREDECFSHREMFIIEDDRPLDDDQPKIPFASFYHQYDRSLPRRIADSVAPLWFRSVHQKLASAVHQFKVLLQRPRPYQMAMMLGHFDFVREIGQTALTPSACSGHCLQGVVGVGGVLEVFAANDVTLESSNRRALQQFAVDIGDRRVMAGIHYPSDNLCSWMILMHLADRVYRNPCIKQWLWFAIEHQSRVYAEILEAAKHDWGRVYEPVLQRIRKLAPDPRYCDEPGA